MERTPDAVALRFHDERLTFRELNGRANRLARRLSRLGVGPEVLAGVLLPRSVELVVSLLAVLKAGGAYLPLDPSYPRERLAFMLEDARAGALVTLEGLLQTLPASKPAAVCLDADAAELAREGEENLQVETAPENLAYLIYTSGSTGRPKGVAIEHRSAVSFLHWARETFAPEDLAGVVGSTSVCFDLSVFEIFAPLSWGGTCLLTEDALHVAGLPADFEPTLVNTVPSAMAELLRLGWEPRAVRVVALAGEALKGGLAAQVYQLGTPVRLLNLYGPSEDTTYSTYVEVPRGGANAPPIGRPLPGKQCFLLDEHLNPVPRGREGELYIGGVGLARGYMGRPGLTAERFVPHPYGDEPGRRLYRTGDVARYLPDGNLEFLGRADQQVKLRGYRIELGEIEARLEEHPAVEESVVVAREDEAGDKTLCAYFVANQSHAPSANLLRDFLRERLPDYMLPRVFMELDEFPRTPNGKTDRRALPLPTASRPHLEKTFVAPRGPVEQRLAKIWAEVLKLDRVGVEDNFFELGGDSLLAARIVARARQEFQAETSLRALFESGTIAAMAGLLDDGAAAAGRRPAPLAWPQASSGEESQPSLAQQRLWLLDQLQSDGGAYNIPLSLRMKGRLDKGAMERAVAEIRRRHEVLRATFASVDGRPVQSFSPPRPEAWEAVDLSGLGEAERGAEVRRLVSEESRREFDLSRGPLLRTTLLRLGDEEHVLLVTMHHIVSDGWSIDIFLQELGALYTAFASGRPSPLAELEFQYSDFASFQRARLQGEVLERQLAYWRRNLSGSLPVFDLPPDRPRLPAQTFRSGTCSLSLGEGVTRALRELGQREGSTAFMVLLANFAGLLYRHTGQPEVVIGTPVAGRNWTETEKLIGLFLNTLPLRLDLSGNPSFRRLLRRVRAAALESLEHQDVPFELLLEELQVVRDLSRTPLFQVMFNMLNYEGRRTNIELPGLTIDAEEILEHSSKYDMTLYVREERGRLLLNLVYNADLFDAPRMESLLSHYRLLLEGVVSDPDRPVSRVPLLTDGEWERIRGRRNAVRPERPFVEFEKEEGQTLGARFERQAALHPRNVAVKTEAHGWTYEQLNGKANRVAHALLAQRGRKGEQIGLLFKHDAPMVAALLGVLKTGKTYVPLDTSYPLERLAYVLEDAQISAVLCDNKTQTLAGRLTAQRVPTLNLDRLDPNTSEENPGVEVAPDALAYILYTSGSTGRPKGVMQSHRNVLHHIRCYTNGLRLSADDRLTLLSSYSFDAAVMDIFGALLNGAALYPVDLNESGFDYLSDCVVNEGITVYHSTPTVYRYFVGGLAEWETLDSVRMVVLGGEEVVAADVELYKRQFSPGCLFINGLGPTESTLAAQYFVAKETEVTRASVPLGYPVPETEILLLDDFGEPVPVHGVGEIAIRSEFIALGYWRNPAATAKAFVPDPAGSGRRMYLTGDLGRLLPDGGVEFKGRKDLQAKIRGYRIELGGIEAVLRRHPSVCECAVAVREDAPGEKRLVAYLVPEEQLAPTPSEMRAFLSNQLPDFMIPSVFVTLEELALTPNGKIDRNALPAPDVSRRRPSEGMVAPSTPSQRALASIWAEVLRLEEVGIHDNFFELGGDSLMLSQLMARLAHSFSVVPPMRVFFGSPTIALQAELLDRRLAEAKEAAGAPPAE
ncbi:MAG TPA: amino acid adenylation domain-containing protein [Pyrinomonadaceae bacterium]